MLFVYRNATYNIPVAFWILDTHPSHAPLCYVTPTPDMSIKVSSHVDGNGKIYLPYLHEWDPNNSDILGLIQMCIITFGEQPPVFARPAGAVQQHQPPPRPVYPPQAASNYPGYPPASSGEHNFFFCEIDFTKKKITLRLQFMDLFYSIRSRISSYSCGPCLSSINWSRISPSWSSVPPKFWTSISSCLFKQ